MKEIPIYGMKIRECPFCGQNGKLEQDMDLTWYVECANKDCYCKPLTAAFATKRSAVLAWNHRYEKQPVLTIVDNN